MMSCCNLHPLVLDYLLKLKPCIKNEKFLEKSVDLKYTLSLGLKNIEKHRKLSNTNIVLPHFEVPL